MITQSTSGLISRFALFALLGAPIRATPAYAEDPPMPSSNLPAAQSVPVAELDSMVAPIALYPDPLLSQVLVASTYPLELVQAQQWIAQNPSLKGAALSDAAKRQSWDPSVQALVVFPDVLKRLNSDITWTTNLGNAFLAQQTDVMDAVQRLRTRAQDAGKLRSSAQQTVTTASQEGQTVVEIQPANPQIMYVPYYQPASVWGEIDYPYPILYYPPSYDWGGPGIFWYGSGISVGLWYGGWHGWNSWGWRPGWYHHDVIVNYEFIHRYHYREAYGAGWRSPGPWHHDAYHRMGVAYPNAALVSRYHASRYRPTVGQTQAQFSQRYHPAYNRGVASSGFGNPGAWRGGSRGGWSHGGGTAGTVGSHGSGWGHGNGAVGPIGSSGSSGGGSPSEGGGGSSHGGGGWGNGNGAIGSRH